MVIIDMAALLATINTVFTIIATTADHIITTAVTAAIDVIPAAPAILVTPAILAVVAAVATLAIMVIDAMAAAMVTGTVVITTNKRIFQNFL
jgi:hypothetical protein